MFKWIKWYNEADSQTRFFILNWVVYSIALIITTLYCYGRLDYVRTYQTPSTIEKHKTIKSD